jgi:peptidoglycan/xylan/chitin deacetylase (PgdA/CDA1 family)
MTNDVESHSFESNTLDTTIDKRIENEAMPRLLALHKKYKVKATFFFVATFAKSNPDIVRMVVKGGHEIACHGYDHTDYYDNLNYLEQFKLLDRSKKIIEDVSGEKVVSFRAPALRINKYTVKALEETGFLFDSSVASQRFDGPFTSGALYKLRWLTAHRTPYYINYDNPFKKGDSSILEIPVSAFFWPFIGTHMRLSPLMTTYVQKLLSFEAKKINKPLVFLFHPNECLSFLKKKTKKRGNYFSDELRHNIKMKNLGEPAIYLLESIFARNHYPYARICDINL